jgi:hypothetical protein
MSLHHREWDRELMKAPKAWPGTGKLLCLKRYVGLRRDGGMERIEFAALKIDASTGQFHFFPEEGKSQLGSADMLDQLISEGWRVD